MRAKMEKMVPCTLYTTHNYTRTTVQTKEVLSRVAAVPVLYRQPFVPLFSFLSFLRKGRDWFSKKGVFGPLGLKRGQSF